MKMKLYLLLFLTIPVIVKSQEWSGMINSNEYSGNYVYIIGETNINCFECRFDYTSDEHMSDNIQSMHSSIRPQTIETYIPVSEFKCNNQIMYIDFQKFLKAAEYPYIMIELDPEQIKNILPDKKSVDLDVAITIANVKNVQPILCSVNNYGNSNVSITGKATIQLVDFQLKPPVKFMGLVKVKDEVTINFSFNFIVV